MLKIKNNMGKRTREMTSTMTALSLTKSFHQSRSQSGPLAFVRGSGEGQVRRGSSLSGTGPTLLPTRRWQASDFDGLTDGVDSSAQPFLSNFESVCTFITTQNNNNNNIISLPMFIVLSSLARSLRQFTRFIQWMHAERQAVPTLRPSQPIWAESPPVGCHHLPNILDRSSIFASTPIVAIYYYYYYSANTHFTEPQRVEGWVDLACWLHTEMFYPLADRHPFKYLLTSIYWRKATAPCECTDSTSGNTARHITEDNWV